MINLPDACLAYLPEGTTHFDDYLKAVVWAQRYAMANRGIRIESILNTWPASAFHRLGGKLS